MSVSSIVEDFEEKYGYLYVLDRDFRKYLGVEKQEHFPPLELGSGLGTDEWAHHEFSDAPLGILNAACNVDRLKPEHHGKDKRYIQRFSLA